MATIHCPVCNQNFDPEHSTAMPFCSDRCRQIDLGRWLDERHSLPIERQVDFDEELPPEEE
ncbi:MAG TPA: DNA gyrase inhibitor YacG [Pirellulales bacterium]|jgi:hypothetical protein